MNGHVRSYRWVGLLAAALAATVVGVVAYNAGFTHGLAQNGQTAVGPGAFPPYGWYRPWGFWFVFPFLFIGLWFFTLRVLFWGGPWRRRYYAGRYEMPSAFDDWHRRAHEQMKTEAAGPSPDEDRSRRR
jgi:hypothetical protein